MITGGAQREHHVLAEIEKFKFSIISTPRDDFEFATILIQTGIVTNAVKEKLKHLKEQVPIEPLLNVESKSGGVLNAYQPPEKASTCNCATFAHFAHYISLLHSHEY